MSNNHDGVRSASNRYELPHSNVPQSGPIDVRPRVCFLTTSYPRSDGDVSGTFVQRLARELAKETDLTVVAPGHVDAPSREDVDGLTVLRFTYFWPRRFQGLAYGRGIPENLRKAPWRVWQVPFLLLGFCITTFRITRTTDVIHANWTPTALAALLAARWHGVPIVLTIRGSDVRSLPTSLTRFILRRVDAITAFGSEAEQIRRLGFPLAIPLKNPIDSLTFHENVDGTAAVQAIGLDPSRPIVSLIARLYDFKDPLTFVDAIPRVLEKNEGIQFAIVGDGALLDEVRERVATLGVESSVAVPGARPDINEILAASSVFVAISPVENVWSATITEATAVGTPCILTRAGHTPAIFTSGRDCLMIEPRDVEGLANAILELINQPDLCASIVANCRELHREHGYDTDEIVSRHVAMYKDLMRHRKG